MRRRRLVGLAIFMLLWSTAVAAAQPRVVAVGDVHGYAEGLTRILRATGVIDQEDRWAGGDTVLIQVGDLVDRGPHVRQVLDLMMRLQREAPEAGGEVVVLLGNHEALNIVGVHEHVNAAAYAEFVDEQSEDRRRRGWRDYQRYIRQRARQLSRTPPAFDSEMRKQWREQHPPGLLEYHDAMAPQGVYGAWLRSLPAAVRRGSVLYIHGGLSPEIADLDLAALNAAIEHEIQDYDRSKAQMVNDGLIMPSASLFHMLAGIEDEKAFIAGGHRSARDLHGRQQQLDSLQTIEGWQQWLLLAEHGPAWFRGAARWQEEERGAEMISLLDAVGAQLMVVGHTPVSSTRVEVRFGGRVFLIDTHMYKTPSNKGRPAALEISAGGVAAVYLDGREELVPLAAKVHETPFLDVDGKPLPFSSDEQVLDFLRTAEVVSSEIVGRGITKPRKLLLEKDGLRAHAVFRTVNIFRKEGSKDVKTSAAYFKDRYSYEVAAYELSLLLGINRVPPVVVRKVAGDRGSVQIWLEDMIMNVDRRERGLKPPDPVRWRHQDQILKLFDKIVGNLDRNLGNLLIDRSWTTWFIDHTRCFPPIKEPLDPDQVTHCERRIWQAMQSLDPEALQQHMKPFLDRSERKSMAARFEFMVHHMRQLIEARGQESVLFDLAAPGPPIDSWHTVGDAAGSPLLEDGSDRSWSLPR